MSDIVTRIIVDSSIVLKTLKEMKLLEPLNNGGIDCYICKCKVTIHNIRYAVKKENEFEPVCDKVYCGIEFEKMISAENV